jgi:hypothetical protein
MMVSDSKPVSFGPSPSVGVVSDSSNASSITSDEDRSVNSSTNSAASSIYHGESLNSGPPVSIVSDLRKDHTGPLPFISNDPEFVASTLREYRRNEVLKAARAMLYDAYMNAAKGEKP